MTPDWSDESPRDCAWCETPLKRFGEDPGETPYWVCTACPKPRRPVLPPQNIGYATALVRGRITDPIRPDDYPDLEGQAPTAGFDPDAPDPARFVTRVLDRLELVYGGVREQERSRRIERSGRTAPDDGRQTGLSGWSA